MAYIRAEIKLDEIARTIPVQLYFPTDLPEEVGNKVKGVITLLHGMSNTGSDWMMMSAATRYAADNGYILVAPSADNSFYADMAFGAAFYTAITEFLPAKLNHIFRIPSARAQNYIAGLSMGGYGAMHIGLKHPDRYAAIGSFSGVLDVAFLMKEYGGDPLVRPMLQSVLGTNLQLPDSYDVFHLAEKLAALPKEQQPRLFCTCGKQDEEVRIYEQNVRFCQHARRLPLDYTFLQWNGVHEWLFWDRSLAEFIGFIQNNDYAQRKQLDWSTPATTV